MEVGKSRRRGRPVAAIPSGNGPSRFCMSVEQKAEQKSRDPNGEFPFTPADYVLHLLTIISLFRDSTLDSRLRPMGLNVGRYRTMTVLDRFGACTMTDVSSFTGVDRTTLTRVADQLVGAGWAERMSEAKDRRQVLLRLTDEGRQVLADAVKVIVEVNATLLEGVPEEDQRLTARALMRVVDNVAPNRRSRDGIIHFSRETLGQDKA